VVRLSEPVSIHKALHKRLGDIHVQSDNFMKVQDYQYETIVVRYMYKFSRILGTSKCTYHFWSAAFAHLALSSLLWHHIR
jgi:hypothetical protein